MAANRIVNIMGRNEETLYLISARAEVVESFLGVSLGLLVGDPRDLVLKLPPVLQSVHTFFMRYPIQVLFLDEGQKIISITTAQPGMIVRPERKAAWCIELGSTLGMLARPGDRVIFSGWESDGIHIDGDVE